MEALFHWLQEQLQSLPNAGRFVAWFVLALLSLLILSLLFSLLFSPFMWLYNRFTDRNRSNVLNENEFVTGELTVKIQGISTGEVRETGSGTAFSVHPARLFDEKEIAAGTFYPIGTKVLIIEFDESGVALVVRNQQFI